MINSVEITIGLYLKGNDRYNLQLIKLKELGHVMTGIKVHPIGDLNGHGERVLVYHHLLTTSGVDT